MTINIKGATIVFDLDGTLVDTAPDLIGAAHHVFAARGLPATDGRHLKQWISYGARRMISEGLATANNEAPDTEIDAMLEQFLVHYEANIANESRPFPGILEALDHLRDAGARLAVCTNKREALSFALLDALDMTKLFDAIAGRDTFPVYKPNPAHLTGAIQMSGGNPTAAVMIGDSHVDIETAKAAGVPSIGVTFGYSQIPIKETKPDMVLNDYKALVASIDGLLEKASQNVQTSR